MLSIIIIVCCCLTMVLAQEERSKDTIKIALMADIINPFPWDNRRVESAYVLDNVYEPLVRYKDGSTDVENCLATEINSSEDFKTWTVHLRKNVLFHDGTALNADAVVASLSLASMLHGKPVKVDDYTVSIELEEPSVILPAKLTLLEYSIASLATVKCYKEKCHERAYYGTGPYKLEHWIPQKEIALEVNEQYWSKKAWIKEAIFVPYRKADKLVKALKVGAVHIALAVPPNSIKDIRDIAVVRFKTMPTLGLGLLAMNVERKPLDNVKVRQAIDYAIDKKELVRKYFFDGHTGAVAQTFAPPQIMKMGDPAWEITYNLEKTKELLAEANHGKSFEAMLLPIYVQRPYMPEPYHIAEDIKNYMIEAGIKIKVITVTTEEDFRKIVRSGNYDMMLFGWQADIVDPDDFLTVLLASESIGMSNLSRWSNKQFNELLVKARQQTNPIERLKLYEEAQAIFHKELPFIPLFIPFQTIAWNEDIIGFTPHPVNRFYLQYISYR